jgi:hypothetical protein
MVRAIGLGRTNIVRPRGRDLVWLLGAIAFGGALGSFLFMYGLRTTDSASASLILNLEGVLTALLAWFAFKENFDRRIAAHLPAVTLILRVGLLGFVAYGLSLTLFWRCAISVSLPHASSISAFANRAALASKVSSGARSAAWDKAA